MQTQFSDPYPFDKHESFSPSDSTTSRRAVHSDEEVLLATSYPKKRAGRRVFKETRHPVFRGVRNRNNDKWVCELREPNKKSRIWLGTYPTPEMAARAHDVAALALRGKSACLNFADSAWRLPVPVSTDPNDIRRAAHEAAELFRPQEFGGQVTRKFGSVVEQDAGEASSSDSKQEVSYIDEEDFLDMPGLLARMAERPLLSPPHYARNDGMELGDHLEADIDVSLWSYSV
ncbi:dehydration-responsive element-binding protein 1E [Ricinus communis]|uniref:Dehydration-responsive element-binding protein 1F, putative n=1 Tax=Ricinus communis TaxID=3988 RepID=B9RC19_RICCO|nr:dehydration-responsive element-binding protein 1E [Ricinus communis]EEF51090.1 Dehydration-responsive element-binding protein 1F, putative [Ricinus communis]|eukprot:XP_002509703.1 dehydration-responsive element-binding protein 1E [Ricinus communis]